MTLTATLVDIWWDTKRLNMVATVVASGSYVGGGDTLNLQLSGVRSTLLPRFVQVNGVAGFLYSYVNGTSLANGKMKVFVNTTPGVNAPFPEHTAVAYVGGVTGDTITLEAVLLGR